jgi:hypothetical protein
LQIYLFEAFPIPRGCSNVIFSFCGVFSALHRSDLIDIAAFSASSDRIFPCKSFFKRAFPREKTAQFRYIINYRSLFMQDIVLAIALHMICVILFFSEIVF